MTISADYAPNIDLGNGTTLAFAVNFPFAHPADLDVTLFDQGAGADVVPAPVLNGTGTYDYTVTGTIDPAGTGIYPNGTVTFNTAPPGNTKVIRARSTPEVQEVVLIDNARFPAKAVEGGLDHLELQIQEMDADLSRAVKAPVSDGPIDMTLPPKEERAGNYLGFDANGLPITPGLPSIAVTVGTAISVSSVALMKALALTAMLVGSSVTLTGYYTDQDSGPDRRYKIVNVNPGTADNGVIVASNTPGYWLVWQNVPETIDIRTYGAILDDNSDGFLSFKNSLSYLNTRGFGTLYVPGKLAVASAVWAASGPLVMTAQGRIAIRGKGRNESWIRFSGTYASSDFLVWRNTGPVHFADIEMVGNSVGGGGNAHWMLIEMTSAATQRMDDIRIERTRWRNFGQDKWIEVRNTSGNFPIDVFICDNDWKSQAGNSYDPTNLGVASTMISLKGCSTGGVGGWIQRNSADGNYVKRFCDVWGDTSNVWVTENTLDNFGQVGAQDGKGGRALQCYTDSGNEPQNINFDSNRMYNCRSGVYVASYGNINCRNNWIFRQTDIIDASLPTAGLGLSGCYGDYSGNTIEEAYVAIFSASRPGTGTTIAQNRIASATPNAIGIKLGPAVGGTAGTRQVATANEIFMTGAASRGYLVFGSAATPLGTVQILGGDVAADRFCIEVSDGGGGPFVGASVRIGGQIRIAGTCTVAMLAASSSTSPIVLAGIILDANNIAAGAAGLYIAGSTDIDVQDIHLKNKNAGAGAMLSCGGARGHMRNVRRSNVADANFYLSSDFGVVKPTWNANRGTFIQNLNEANGAGSATTGWANDNSGATWTTRTASAA